MSVLSVEDFGETGVVLLPGAFSAEAATAMRQTIWRFVEARTDIRLSEPTTWEGASLAHLSFKSLKARAVFAPMWENAALAQAMDLVFGAGNWVPPRRGARFLVSMPGPGGWVMPTGWHMDGDFSGVTYPVPWVQLWAVLENLDPGGGGTLLLAGSHRLVERYRPSLRPDQMGGNSVSWGRFMRQHPHLDALRRGGSEAEPARDLLDRDVDVEGVTVKAIEVCGAAGDLYFSHGQVFHCPSPNASDRPRQMLTGAVKRSTR